MKVALIAFAVLAASRGPALSRGIDAPPPQQRAAGPHQHAIVYQRGTEKSPVFVRVVPLAKSPEETRQDSTDRKGKAANDNAILKFNGRLVVIGCLQLAVFVGQLAVFGWQGKQLSRTVGAMKSQEVLTRASIEVATQVELPRVYITDIALVSDARASSWNDDIMYFVTVTLVNYGRTPAYITRAWFGQIVAENLPTEPTFNDLSSRESTIILEPGKAYVWEYANILGLGDELRGDLAARRSHAWVWAKIEYADFLNGVTTIGAAGTRTPWFWKGAKKDIGLPPLPFSPDPNPKYTFRRYRPTEPNT